jgi:drug/metabolite transporter (DMT)-like permease
MNMNLKIGQGFSFSLIAAILIFTNALLLGIVITWFPWIMPVIPGTTNEAVPFGILIAVGFTCAFFCFARFIYALQKLGKKRV